jgi:hypothetical protein
MGMTQTDKNKQLKRNAIRLRMELGAKEGLVRNWVPTNRQSIAG